MSSASDQRGLIVLACAFEYALVGTVTALALNSLGPVLVIGAVSGVVNFLISGGRFAAKYWKRFLWLAGCACVDLVLFTLGLAVYFEIIGGHVFKSIEALRGLAVLSLQIAAALAGVRLTISIAIRLLGLEREPAPL